MDFNAADTFKANHKIIGLVSAIIILMIEFWFMPSSAAASETVLLLGNSFTGATFLQITNHSLFKERWIGGYNLDQHFNDSQSRSEICDDHTFVLLQNHSTRAHNPSAFDLDFEQMIPYVESCGATPVLFMTWQTTSIDFGTVRNAYERVVDEQDVQMVPIGLVFHRARQQSESLYQSFILPDGKHPTIRGSKVAAACVLRAFCSSCYQQFDWSGFTASEVSFIKGVIGQYVYSVNEVEPPPPPPPPPEEPNRAFLPVIIDLLLD